MDFAEFQIMEGPKANQSIKVLFNPTEYTDSISVVESGEDSNKQFKVTRADEFTVNLFFDTYPQRKDVRDVTKQITALVIPEVEGVQHKKPPKCAFLWGGFQYTGYVTKISQRYTMFLDTGIPVRSEMTVTLRPDIPKELDNRNKGTEGCRKLWTVKSNDRIDLIAFRTLKDATRWRIIAEVNQITDPLAFPTADDIGKQLVIPDWNGV